MRVLFFNWEYPPQGSGIGRYNELLTTALRKNGHFCVIVTSSAPGWPEKEELDNGILYRLCPMEEMGWSEQSKRVLEIAAENRIDLIEGADHLGHCAALLREIERPRVCIKLHYNDVLYDLRYAQAAYPWQRFLILMACVRQYKRLAAERYSMEAADFVTAPCKEILLRAKRQGVRLSDRMAVLPNPVELPDIDSQQNSEAEQPTLLFVGRVDFGKGVQFLPHLLHAVRQKFPAAVLEIAGPDCSAKGIPSILRWLKKRTEDDAIRYLGMLNREELDKAYRRAWLVLSPSRWDTFPNTVLEAMAYGKPVAASSFGGAQEVLRGTDNIVGKPESDFFIEKICRVLSEPDLRRRIGKQGEERVKVNYLPDYAAKKYVNWFREVL
ncbi:MAG: glycosyltransferase family 1 protein [Candidatus Electrothrix sp. AW1]|nr:glycosyltransferase family 1 protein [Candidatus Electrothrix sp. AX1]MCI5181169.1 glycosyltransferase family 1 protein [Candidatus Electrothrix gigas]